MIDRETGIYYGTIILNRETREHLWHKPTSIVRRNLHIHTNNTNKEYVIMRFKGS